MINVTIVGAGSMSNSKPARGRFSESYPLDRQCMRPADWPDADRLAFERARKMGDAFDLPGPAALWASTTCRGRLQAYGRYLNFLRRQGLLLESEGPADRITPERLALYLAEASQLLSARTTDQTLMELRRVLGAMVPEREWRWITRHPDRPTRAAVRASGKPKKSFDSRVVCSKALDLMDHISAGQPSIELRILYRNALIVVIQCVFALRRDNLIHMKLGRNLIIGDEVIHMIFQSGDPPRPGLPCAQPAPVQQCEITAAATTAHASRRCASARVHTRGNIFAGPRGGLTGAQER